MSEVYGFIRKHPLIAGLFAFLTIALGFAASPVLGVLLLLVWIVGGGAYRRMAAGRKKTR